MIRVGVIGHRYLGNDQVRDFVAREISNILQQTQSEYHEVIALSALAEGADTVFAEAAIALGFPLEVVRPFRDYAEDFTADMAQARYQRLRRAARREEKLDYSHRSDQAYLAAMDWVIADSDLVIVVWDGRPAMGPAGTGNSVQRIVKINRPWIHINTVDRSIATHMTSSSQQ